MTDIHDNDDNTPSEGHERIDFDLNPEYDKYGIQSLDDGTLILRIDSEKHLFERVGAIRCEQTEVVLQRFLKGENLEDEGLFRTFSSVPARRDEFDQHFGDAIFDLVHNDEISEQKCKKLTDHLLESFIERDKHTQLRHPK
jgi:hypothetical protein